MTAKACFQTTDRKMKICKTASGRLRGYEILYTFVAISHHAGLGPVIFVEGIFQSGQMGQTVNLLAFAFGGSNPSVPTLVEHAMLRK